MAIRIVPLDPYENELLETATLGNLNWNEVRFTPAEVRDRTDFRHYTLLQPQRGDFGLVAQDDDGIVAVAWAVFLPADDPGFGFVEEAIPELSLWVRPNRRRRVLAAACSGRWRPRLVGAESPASACRWKRETPPGTSVPPRATSTNHSRG